MIAIVDYDIGNLSAVSNMIRYLGGNSQITRKSSDLENAEKIILPGNGAFDACVRNLRATGMLPTLERRVLIDKVPLLGICVGAQMLGETSEEGVEKGLGWLDMRVRKFPKITGLPLPHMGWSMVSTKVQSPIVFDQMADDTRFYFVHSYYMDPKRSEDILLEASYGVKFAAAVGRDNIIGVQFHPEKSHRFGKQMLARFLEWR